MLSFRALENSPIAKNGLKKLQTIQSFFRRRQKLASLATYAVMTMVPRGANAMIAIAYGTVMSPGELGIYGVCLSIQTILAFLLDGGISLAIVRTYYDHHSDKAAASGYMARMILTSRITSLLFSMILFGLGTFFWRFLTAGQVPFWPIFPLVLFAGYLERSGELLANISRAMERPKIFALGDAAQAGMLIVSAILLVVVLKQGVLGALLAVTAGSFTRTIVYSYLLRQSAGIKWVARLATYREFREAIVLGMPLVLNQLSNWGRQMGQRVILLHIVQAAEVGAFFLASSISNILFVFVQAISAVFDPLYYKRRVEGAKGFRGKVQTFTEIYFATLAVIILPCIIFINEINHSLFKNKYPEMGPVAAILLAASYARLQSPLISKQLLFQKRTQWILPTTVIPSLLTLFLTPFVIPFGGLIAVAWLVLLAGVVSMLGLGLAVLRYESLDYPVTSATSLLLLVIAVATWISLGAPLPGGAASIYAKTLVAVVSISICTFVWIWRKRDFLKSMIQN